MTAERDALRVARDQFDIALEHIVTLKEALEDAAENALAGIDYIPPQALPVGDWWYVVDKDGNAKKFDRRRAAEDLSAHLNYYEPELAPYRVAQLYEVAQPEQIALSPEKDAEFQRVIEGPVQEEKAAKIMSALIDKLYQLSNLYNDRTCDHDVCKEVRDARAYIVNQPDTFTPDEQAISTALRTLEDWAIAGNVLAGDNVGRLQVVADKLAPPPLPRAWTEAERQRSEKALQRILDDDATVEDTFVADEYEWQLWRYGKMKLSGKGPRALVIADAKHYSEFDAFASIKYFARADVTARLVNRQKKET